MQPSTNTDLSCLVFGHNYFKFETERGQALLICKHCKTKTNLDDNGDFETEASSNLRLQNTLKQLFVLNKRLALK
ncbi:hypothetical protein Q2T40_17965 [Winogradskyella maritima]|uniref:Prophage protein DUF1660 n=1 Tax=Winogradskyella maritima TaxID=1517766 RepID=A0ABV8AI22_9FLAO|nr:hypothetical protein [Winogradskyella maritima]